MRQINPHPMTSWGIAFAAAAFLVALPACAQDDPPPEQIIGTPPAIDCCWGYTAGQDFAQLVAQPGDSRRLRVQQ